MGGTMPAQLAANIDVSKPSVALTDSQMSQAILCEFPAQMASNAENDVIVLSMLGLKLNHVSKRGPCCHGVVITGCQVLTSTASHHSIEDLGW